MYASIRQYRMEPDSVPEAMHRVDEELADRFAAMPGFVAYHVMDCGDGQICSITTFRDAEDADRSADMAAQWVRERLSEFGVERTGAQSGGVVVSRAQAEVLEPAHA
jgi:hypothetical protein